jgi:hypothetical protein
VANAFISPFDIQTMHIKSFYAQQHCYVSPKKLIPGRDSNPGILVSLANVKSTAPRRQGRDKILFHDVKSYIFKIYYYR